MLIPHPRVEAQVLTPPPSSLIHHCSLLILQTDAYISFPPNHQMLRPTVFVIVFVIVIAIVFVLVFNRCSRPPDAAFYRQRGLRDLKRALEAPRFEGKAKNVIVFVGDGLGVYI